MHIEYDLNSLFNFLRLRLNKETPFEVKVYAEAMLLLIEGVAPLTVAAFRKQILGTANPLA
jgi:thymidylate synthase ThyX